jgi:hypothetical protein
MRNVVLLPRERREMCFLRGLSSLSSISAPDSTPVALIPRNENPMLQIKDNARATLKIGVNICEGNNFQI